MLVGIRQCFISYPSCWWVSVSVLYHIRHVGGYPSVFYIISVLLVGIRQCFIQFNSIPAFIDAAYMHGQRRLTISSKSKSTLILVSVRTINLVEKKIISYPSRWWVSVSVLYHIRHVGGYPSVFYIISVTLVGIRQCFISYPSRWWVSVSVVYHIRHVGGYPSLFYIISITLVGIRQCFISYPSCWWVSVIVLYHIRHVGGYPSVFYIISVLLVGIRQCFIQFNSIPAFIDAAYMHGQRRLTISSKSKSTLILVSVRTINLVEKKIISYPSRWWVSVSVLYHIRHVGGYPSVFYIISVTLVGIRQCFISYPSRWWVSVSVVYHIRHVGGYPSLFYIISITLVGIRQCFISYPSRYWRYHNW